MLDLQYFSHLTVVTTVSKKQADFARFNPLVLKMTFSQSNIHSLSEYQNEFQ